MTAVRIAGCGLACSLGLSVADCVAALSAGGRAPESRVLPGGLGGKFPYHAIPLTCAGWHERARDLVTRVAAEAGAGEARYGALLIATSSFDIGAIAPAEAAGYEGDYRRFVDRVAGWLDWKGPVYAISTACTSSLNAMLVANSLLRAGAVGDALVLGIELGNPLTLGGFAALQLLSRNACRPFGAGRDGLVLGESVVAVRQAAGGQSGWRLLGGANVVDGSQPTGASATALDAMYRQALADSGLAAHDVDLIKVQAAGSPGNDEAEAMALRAAFAHVPPLVSLKPAIGHTMGASGAAEVALLLGCLESNAWPACPWPIDPGLGVTLATVAPTEVRRVLATILGFGGSHASVVLEKAP